MTECLYKGPENICRKHSSIEFCLEGPCPDEKPPLCESCARTECSAAGQSCYPYFCSLGYAPKPQTNADRIRSMTDEELAEWMRDNIDCGLCSNILGEPQPCMRGKCCVDSWSEWLKQEVQG